MAKQSDSGCPGSHPVRSKNRSALESLGYQLPGWDFEDAVGRFEGAVMDWARMLAYVTMGGPRTAVAE
jgi:hypothetical protein